MQDFSPEIGEVAFALFGFWFVLYWLQRWLAAAMDALRSV